MLTLSKSYPCRSVVINSPGFGHLPGVKGNRGYGIHNINSRYGFINKIGSTIGKLELIDVPEKEQEAKEIFESFDKKDFEKSIEKFNQSHKDFLFPNIVKDDVEARTYRAKAYLGSIDTMSAFPETHDAYMKCENEHEAKSWYDLKDRIAQMQCGVDAVVETCASIFRAQHSIENVIKTLQQKENSHKANIFVS